MLNNQKQLKEYIQHLVKEVLLESKQNLINLGYPDIISTILMEEFGKNAFLIAKWLKEYNSYQWKENPPKEWWNRVFNQYNPRSSLNAVTAVELYNAALDGKEAYEQKIEEVGLGGSSDDDDFYEPFDQQRILKDFKTEAKEQFFKDIFFYSTLVKDIKNGKISNLQPYKKMTFKQAKDAYDKKRLFDNEEQIIKQYKNGWKWIDAGPKCQLIGGLMKNCGSTGVMSTDKDKTMLTLFDTNNNPHILVTFSPNEKKISGAEGSASTAPKEKYHQYIFDISKHLGAKFDWAKTKGYSLKLKGAFGDRLEKLEPIKGNDEHSEYFLITLKDGGAYYTNSYSFIPAEKLNNFIKSNNNFNTPGDVMDEVFKNTQKYADQLDIVGIYKLV